MGISKAQLARRKDYIGSSDMAAILGLSPFGNAYDVWLEKTGKLIESEPNEAMQAGVLLEPAVLQYAENELGKLTRNQFRSAKDLGFPLGANIDAIVVSTGEPVEAKTSGIKSGSPFEKWGDPLTDQVPESVIIQATVHLICLIELKTVCHIPALLGGRGFQRFAVPYDADIADAIKNTGYRFWNDHVLADIPPDNLTPNLAVVKRLRREPSKTVTVEQSLIETWQGAVAAESIAKKDKEASLAAILAAVGDAEAAECPLGTFTYLAQTRGAYEVKESTYRVARFKKAK